MLATRFGRTGRGRPTHDARGGRFHPPDQRSTHPSVVLRPPAVLPAAAPAAAALSAALSAALPHSSCGGYDEYDTQTLLLFGLCLGRKTTTITSSLVAGTRSIVIVVVVSNSSHTNSHNYSRADRRMARDCRSEYPATLSSSTA